MPVHDSSEAQIENLLVTVVLHGCSQTTRHKPQHVAVGNDSQNVSAVRITDRRMPDTQRFKQIHRVLNPAVTTERVDFGRHDLGDRHESLKKFEFVVCQLLTPVNDTRIHVHAPCQSILQQRPIRHAVGQTSPYAAAADDLQGLLYDTTRLCSVIITVLRGAEACYRMVALWCATARVVPVTRVFGTEIG